MSISTAALLILIFLRLFILASRHGTGKTERQIGGAVHNRSLLAEAGCHNKDKLILYNTVCKVWQCKVWQVLLLHSESKKQGTTILSITSPNVDRFSNFFH